ncbi:ribonuclease H-like domain-containing protein [Tanacetum coccineum]
MLSSTGVKPSTSASGSQPSGNTKKDKFRNTSKEQINSWGSIVSDVPSSSLDMKAGSSQISNLEMITCQRYWDMVIIIYGMLRYQEFTKWKDWNKLILPLGKFYLLISNHKVSFRQHTCFIHNLEGVDLLTGSRGNNPYTLSLGDMMASSPICLLSKASNDYVCSSGPALHEMTTAIISLGLIPNPPPSTLLVPPSRTKWYILFQPMFDELLTPLPSVDLPDPEVIAPIDEVVAPVPAVSTGSPFSIIVDQDAPSPIKLDDTGTLKKALYGLKQAPRMWYDMLSSFLISQDFSKGSVDPTLFIHKEGKELLLVQVYVNDIIFVASTLELCDRFAKIILQYYTIGLSRPIRWVKIAFNSILQSEATSLVDVSVTTIAEPPLVSATTLPPPPTPLITHMQQTPVPTPTTVPSSSLQDLPNFGSLFGFDHRLKTLETDFSEFKQTNQFAEAVSSIPGIVDAYLANKMHEAVKTVVQLQSDKLRDEALAENEAFLNSLDDNIKKIIKDQVKQQVKAQVSKILPRIEKTVNEQLEAEVMTRSSTESKTSHVVAANLSELELKKILIDKMESNKSIHRSDEQKNLYKALVEAYESDKLILDTYGDIVSFKIRRDDEDKDEEPSDGYQTGGPREDKREKNQKEPMHTDKDLEEPTHQEFDIGATEEQFDEETSQHPDWFQKPAKPPTPDRDWNKTLPAVHEPVQLWLSNLAREEGPRESFNELMDTPLDFSAFMMNRIKFDTLTPELLAGLTFELVKGKCKSLVELEYFFEEVYKATTDQLDCHNLEGQQYPHDMRKPLPLIPNSRGHQVIPFDHFNNELAYLSGGVSSRTYATSATKTKAVDYGHIKWIEDLVPNTIWSEVPLQIVEWHINKHLDWITIRRDDDKLYTFKEGDFKRLRLQDIEDMLILLVQCKLTNLNVEDRLAFGVSLRMFTRNTYRSDLKRSDAYIAYYNPRGFIYQNKDKKNKLMRIDELHKFSDGTLDDVRTALNDRLKGIRMEYLPKTIWRQSDRERAKAMIQAIDKQLKSRRIMRSLEKFVGGRPYEEHAEFDESDTHVLERFDTSAGNPVKEILLKLNLPDHRSILTDSKILKDGGEVKEFQRSFRHSDTERLSRSDEVLKLKNFKKDATLKLFKSTNQERSHSRQDKEQAQDLKSMITTSNHKLMIEVKDYGHKTKVEA